MDPCPDCGLICAEGTWACPSCGSPLAPAADGATEERKVVTTLFCDLVAFTAMSDEADPEDVDATLRHYHAAVCRVIEAHGGVVEKYIGDAVVGVFGVPSVHEDDAERAVRACLRIVQALTGMTRPDGSALEARCGVDTGEAVVRLDVDPASGCGFLVGDAVNTAARLQAAAPPMGVAVGARSYELTRHVFVYEELSPVAAKGKKAPLAVWRPVRPVARTGLRTSIHPGGPFVGRHDELHALEETLAAVRALGRRRSCLIVGEPGIGKSRLVLEFARTLESDPESLVWRQGRCLPYGEGVALAPLAEIFRAHCGILDSDDPRAMDRRIEAALPPSADAAWLRQRLRALLGLPAPASPRDENFSGWRRILDGLATSHPAVVVFEDLHWGHDVLLDFIDSFVVESGSKPLLLVATTRPELLARRPSLAAPGSGWSRSLLQPLTPADIERLVARSQRGPSHERAAAIAELSGGNPLFAETYAGLLADGGVLPASGPTGVAGGQSPPAPDAIRAVLAARLDTLPRAHKTALADASVFGEAFWLGGVEAMSPLPGAELARIFAALVDRQFVRPAATSSLQGEEEYLFWHALARDVAYGQQTRAERARRHAAAAAWLEEKGRERPEDHAGVVAHHYATAHDLAKAAGRLELAEALRPLAARSLEFAGTHALAVDVPAAERYLARALELIDRADAMYGRALAGRARALLRTGRNHEAESLIDGAVASLRAAGDLRGTASALCVQSDVAAELGKPYVHFVEEAGLLLADDGPSPELTRVLSRLSWVPLQQRSAGGPEEAIRRSERTIAACGDLDVPEAVDALDCRGMARIDLGDVGGLDDLQDALAAASRLGLGEELLVLQFNTGSALLALRGVEASMAMSRSGMEAARLRGSSSFLRAHRAGLFVGLRHAGAWNEALAEARDLEPELDRADDVFTHVLVRSVLAVLLVERGQAGEASPWVEWLIEKGRENEIRWCKVLALAGSAVALQALGQGQRAMKLLREVGALERGVVAAIGQEIVLPVLRDVLHEGDVGLALRLCSIERLGTPWDRSCRHDGAGGTGGSAWRPRGRRRRLLRRRRSLA